MKKLSLALAALMVVGCTHLPKEEATPQPAPAVNKLSVANAEQTIVKGKTTKKEVQEKIGVPNSVERRTPIATDDPQVPKSAVVEIWHYWTVPPMQSIRKGGPQPIFRLWVSYDEQGVVVDYNAADTAIIIR